jgi:glyoxylase-like metal-dependent hydrolase (beta-lactamase superfamily II)
VDDLVSLIPTPGHTIDHYAVQLGRGGKDAVITGDLIHTPLQAKYPELAMRVDYDPAQGAATRRKFLETYCDTSTLCCFAHFPSPSRGYVKRWGDGFKCDYVAN